MTFVDGRTKSQSHIDLYHIVVMSNNIGCKSRANEKETIIGKCIKVHKKYKYLQCLNFFICRLFSVSFSLCLIDCALQVCKINNITYFDDVNMLSYY